MHEVAESALGALVRDKLTTLGIIKVRHGAELGIQSASSVLTTTVSFEGCSGSILVSKANVNIAEKMLTDVITDDNILNLAVL